MTAAVPMLEDALVWQHSGHLAEPAIAALADGEGALLPQPAVHHAVTCNECSERVGLAALFSLEVAAAVGQAELAIEPQFVAQPFPAARLQVHKKTSVPAQPARAPLPTVVPALCVIASLAAGAPLLATLHASSPAHVLAQLARIVAGAALAARAAGIAELSWLAAALLVGAGVMVARGAARTRPQLTAGIS